MSEERRITPQQAREQAAEATGFLASIEIVVGDEVFEIPQRGLLDDDQREALNELELETESWDREPDIEIPERRTKNDDGSETVIAAETRPGALKIPYRKDGKLIKPAYAVRVAVALLGEERYKKFKAGGGRAADITATLARLDKRIEKRAEGEEGVPADPKSVAGDSGVESVPDRD